MDSKDFRKIAILVLTFLSQLLLFTECSSGQQQRAQVFSPAQNAVRKRIGLLKSSYTPEETEGLNKQIDALVARGTKSALFDRALLCWRDGDLLKIFKGFKTYFDATGDDTRIFLYASHGYLVDSPDSEFHGRHEVL